jgi:diamine N-acetyltransferase
MSNISARPALPADLPTIIQLAQKIWQDWYPAIIGQTQVDYMLQRMYSTQSLEAQMSEKGHQFHILMADNQPVGYCSISADNCKDFFIHKFYIDTRQHRKGLGKYLMAYIVDNYQPQTLRLTVNRKNFIPINFYFREGFVIEKVEDFDIGDGYFMNDFVMLRKV